MCKIISGASFVTGPGARVWWCVFASAMGMVSFPCLGQRCVGSGGDS